MTVTASAAAPSVNLSGTDQMTATVTGSSNTAVTWTASAGAINAAGLYTAPADLGANTTVTITATSQADATKSAAVNVTLASTEAIARTSPAALSATLSSTVNLGASVTGSSSDTAVTWTVSGGGTVSASGVYTAPNDLPANPSVTVTAAATADASKTVTTTINLLSSVQVSLTPGVSTVQAGATQSLTASVAGSQDTGVSYSLLENGAAASASTAGTISASGIYTAPATVAQAAVLTAVATANADASRSASVTINLVPSVGANAGLVVLASVPAPGASAADPGAPLVVSLSSALDATTLNSANVVLQNATSGDTVPASLAFDAGTNNLTITPTSPLNAGTAYALTLGIGLANTSGQALAAAYSDSFTTMNALSVAATFNSAAYSGSGASAFSYQDAAASVASDGSFTSTIFPDGVTIVSVDFNGHVYQAIVTATPSSVPASVSVNETTTAAYLVLFSEGLIGTNATQTAALVATAEADPAVQALAAQLSASISGAWMDNSAVQNAFTAAVNAVTTDLAAAGITQQTTTPAIQGGRPAHPAAALSVSPAVTSPASCVPTVQDLAPGNYVSVRVGPAAGQFLLTPSFTVASPEMDWIVDVQQVDPTTIPAGGAAYTALPQPLSGGTHELLYLPSKTDPGTVASLRSAIQNLVSNVPVAADRNLSVPQSQSTAYLFTMYSGGMAVPEQNAVSFLTQDTESGLGAVLNPIAFSANMVAALGPRLGAACRDAVIENLFASGSTVGLQGNAPASLTDLLSDMSSELSAAFTAAGSSCAADHALAIVDEIGAIEASVGPAVTATNNQSLQLELAEAASLVDRAFGLWDTVGAVNATLVTVPAVTNCTAAAVTVTPPKVNMNVGDTPVTLTAAATDAGKNPISSPGFTWSVQNPAVASVIPAADGGTATVTAVNPGQTVIQVNAGNAPPALVPVSVKSTTPPLLVFPVVAIVPLNGTTRLQAIAPPSSTAPITWTSSNQTLATVAADGTVSGVAVGGPVTITATQGAASGSASVTVVPANAPAIVAVQPQPIPVGVSLPVDIFGAFFNAGATVSFTYNGTTVAVPAGLTTFLNSTHLQVVMNLAPAALTTGQITVTNPDKSAGSYTFQVQTVSATSIQTSPSPVAAGQPFTFSIAGNGFDPKSATVVFVGPGCGQGCIVANSALTAASATAITGSTTLESGEFHVFVQNGTARPAPPLVLQVPGNSLQPQITGFKPTPAPIISGTAFAFVITGTGFDPSSAAVNITGPGCENGCTVANGALAVTATQISGTTTLGVGTFSLVVQNATTAGGASNPISINVLSAASKPTLTTITTSPNPPVAGQTFVFALSGANFDPASVTVQFNGPGCSNATGPQAQVNCSIANTALTSKAASEVQGSINLSAGTYTVQVLNQVNLLPSASNVVTFTVPQAIGTPVLGAITTTPNPPAPNTAFSFSLIGAHFDPASVEVTFTGPGCASGCVVGNSALTAATAGGVSGSATLGAGSFDVTVQNGATGTASHAVTLLVSASGPAITSIQTSPNPPSSGQTFSFSILGTGFDPASSTVILAGPSCTVSAPCTLATSALTIGPTVISGSTSVAQSGVYSVIVRNTSSNLLSTAAQLTVVAPPNTPTLTNLSISPAKPQTGQTFFFTGTGINIDPTSVNVIITGVAPNTACASGCTVPALSAVTSTSFSGSTQLAAGAYTLVARNAAGPVSNAENFRVFAPNSLSASVSPTSGAINTTKFVFSGTGATPNGTVRGATTYPDHTIQYITMTADANGNYSNGSGLTYAVAGTYSEQDTDVTSGALSPSYSFGVTNGTPVLSAITTNPAPAVAGAVTVTLAGTGFDPSSALMIITGTTPSSGCANGCTVPHAVLTTATATGISGPVPLTAGSYSVVAENGAGGTASNALTLTVVARSLSAHISPSTGVVNSTLFTVTGSGATPGATVTGNVTYPDSSVHNVTMTANSGGAYSYSFTASTAGNYSEVDVDGASGGVSNSYAWTVTSSASQPAIVQITTTPNPPVAHQNFTFTLTGSGFDVGSVKVIFTSANPASPCATGCIVPNSALGTHTATIIQAQENLPADTYAVAVENVGGAPSPSVSLTVAAGVGGSGTLTLTQILTTPNPPVGGQAFTFAAVGTGFSPVTTLTFTGPGCASGCSLSGTKFTAISSNQLQGGITLASGTFAVTAVNSGGTPTPALTLVVQ